MGLDYYIIGFGCFVGLLYLMEAWKRARSSWR